MTSLVSFLFFYFFWVLKNDVWDDESYGLSLLYYQVATNSAVNRNLAHVTNNWNNSSKCLWTNKVINHIYFCMIDELITRYKIIITDICFNFIGIIDP